MKYLIMTFVKIGLLTFGGGSSVTPLLFNEFVSKTKLLSNEEFIDIVTIANILPGPSMIQMSTAIGYKLKGNIGSVLAPLFISIPSIVIFTLCMTVLNEYVDFKILIAITTPLFLVIGFSMIQVIKKLASSTKITVLPIIIFVSSFVAIFYFDIPSGIVILFAIIIGVIRGFVYVD